MIVVNLLIAMAIAWMAFCRAYRMDARTRPEVRWSIAALGAASTALAVAPLVWGLRVHLAMLLFEGANLLVLLVMSSIWRHGVPPQLLRER